MLLKKGEVTVWRHMALDLQPHFLLPGILLADSYYHHGRKKETTEDEMIGWHHWLKGPKFEQTQGYSERQGGPVCYSPWSRKESDMTTTTMGGGWQAANRCDTCGNTVLWQRVRWPDLILSIACETMAATGIAEILESLKKAELIFSPRWNFRSWNLETKNPLFLPQVDYGFFVGFCALAQKSASKSRGCLGCAPGNGQSGVDAHSRGNRGHLDDQRGSEGQLGG